MPRSSSARLCASTATCTGIASGSAKRLA
jgi:hypothetical protein